MVPEAAAPIPSSLAKQLLPYAGSLAQGSTRHGDLVWLRHDDPVGVALSLYGEWAQLELAVLEAFLRPGDVVLDIGGYIGTHTRSFARAVGPTGRVIAFEPQPVVVDVLRRNGALGPARVEVVQAAVGAEQGSAAIAAPAVGEHGNFGAMSLGAVDASADLEVPVVRVDDLSLEQLRLMKIDVEGMEADVLRGAERTVAALRPVVYAECNTLEAGARVFELLRSWGYRLWLHRPAAFNPGNTAGEEHNVFGVACESNVLAVPQEGLDEALAVLGDRPDLCTLESLDDLALALIRTPRFGDETPYERDSDQLRLRLRDAQAQHEQVLAQASSARAAAEREAQTAADQLAAAEREQAEVLSRLSETQDDLVRHQARVRAMEESTAWRVTAPLRLVGNAKRSLAAHPVGRALRLLLVLPSGRLREEVRGSRYRQALAASGLFDADFYVSTNPDVPRDRALEHYLRHGAAEGRRPNRVFDPEWYAMKHSDVAVSGIDPLMHYLLTGAAEGRDPSPQFSTTYYLARNEDVRKAGTNPLVHYLLHGEAEGRPARPARELEAELETEAPPPEPPSENDWRGVSPLPAASDDDPVLVVPVYKGYAETLRCLYSVLVSPQARPYRLIVVDDCSPNAALSSALAALAERGLFELLHNETNQGFVRSVNRAMRLAAGSDVVLLNSDTEVYSDWLDRLRTAAWSEPKVASVTPLTNSGTVASYPRFVRDNRGLLELPFEQLDELAAQHGSGRLVDLPTCVGFCVYLRRDALADVGLFDEEAFGLGYGEENDWSLRAVARGWRNVLTGSAFVRHYGSTSFGETAAERQRSGLAVINGRYPEYERDVRRHIEADPARALRRDLDLARLQVARAERPSVLFLTHGLGGGTARHVQDLARRLDEEGVMPLVLSPSADGTQVRLSSPLVAAVPNLDHPWGRVPDGELLAVLRDLDVRHLHVHHLQGYEDAPQAVQALSRALGLLFDVTLHDFMTICPRVDMVDHTRRYCGGPEVDKCRRCISRNGSPFGRPDAGAWQRDHAAYLRSARRVVVPSEDTAERFRSSVPGVDYYVLPHPEVSGDGLAGEEPPRAEDGATHVALLGAISIGKGSEVLLALAQDADRRSLPLRFHVFGYTNADGAFRGLDNVDMSGKYAPEDLSGLVAASGSRLALFPTVAPETFSYTLSEALDLGLHPVSFDIGAVADRIRRSGQGTVLPFELVDAPGAVNDRLLQIAPQAQRWARSGASYPSLLRDYYGLPDLQPDRSAD